MKNARIKYLALATVSTLTVLLAACSGTGNVNVGPSLSVVAFGDSLTDGGTYANGIVGLHPVTGAPITITSQGGGKFTTNSASAKTWAEVIAADIGSSASFTPAAFEGFSLGYSAQAGKLNYAQGGSKVTVTNANLPSAASEISVTTQITRHLTAYPAFSPRQLVLIEAGANDIFQAGGVAATITTAAQELAVQAKRLQTAGADRIAIANLPDMGKTPAAAAGGAAQQAGLTQLSALYNSTLKTALDAQGVNYLWIDVFSWFQGVIANPAANGLTNTSGVACNLALTNNTSLFCSSATLVVANADMTYAFADGVHPTTKMHQLFGAFALAAIRAQGW